MTPRQKELINRYARCESMLDPENLYMDGERSPTDVVSLRKSIYVEQRSIVRELGFVPSYNHINDKISH